MDGICLRVAMVALLAMAAAPVVAAPPDAAELAATIDRRLAEKWQSLSITPAPLADDAEFLRRASLDITGRIPRSGEVYAFLADTSPTKRARLIDRLLLEPRFAVHFSNLWRAELVPETVTNRQAAELERGFENWLVQQLRQGVLYDQFVRDLLTVPLPGSGQPAEPVLRDPQRPNPLAFIAAKDSKPENIAAAVTRTFLGIRLECAQCHDHPFAKWTQKQFWSQAAFFAGVEKQGNSLLAPLREVADRHEITYPRDGQLVSAEFLVNGAPQWRSGQSARETFAQWLTSSENRLFARAAANRLWGQFFGVGIVDPVDDFHDNNPPSAPELLDDLASAFVQSGFDLQWMIRGICQSQAYQRTSATTDASQEGSPLPARMTVKALTGEQFYDSFVLATGLREGGERIGARQQFLARFALVGPASEPETSVQQALTLLNGRSVAQAADPENSPTLVAVTQTPFMTTAARIESLYVAALSRRPAAEELQKLEHYLAAVPAERQNERLSDIFWMLLNSLEFRVNH